MMDIDKALRAMDSTNRDIVKKNIEAYNRTGNLSYAKETIEILKNFDSDDAVKELIKKLSR